MLPLTTRLVDTVTAALPGPEVMEVPADMVRAPVSVNGPRLLMASDPLPAWVGACGMTEPAPERASQVIPFQILSMRCRVSIHSSPRTGLTGAVAVLV